MKPQWIIAVVCFTSFLLLAGCTAVSQPTATPEALTDLVQIRPSATTTPTAILETAVPVKPTKTPRATQTPRPTRTPIPTITPTATYTPSPTPTPIAWHPGITELMRVGNLVWSPAENEFVAYEGCPFGDELEIYFVDMNNLQKIDFTPAKLCYYVSLLWHPSGNYFFFSSESMEEDNMGYDVGWKVELPNFTIDKLEWGDSYWGWLDDESYVSEDRVGSGIFSIGIYNTVTEKGLGGTSGFDGTVKDVSQNYVILNEELWFTYNTKIAVLAQEEVTPEFEGWLHGTYIKFLGWNGEQIRISQTPSVYSRYMDVLPNSDQVLALTWNPEEFAASEPNEVLTGEAPTSLQLWDINTDELSLVKEGGIYGRFSPSGNELVVLTAAPESPQLELINRQTNQTIISQPAYAVSDEYTIDVVAFTSFSPNGRFLTYYSPEQDLVVYDIALGTFLPSVTAVPFTPVWSPDNGRFVYQDPDNGLSIYEVDSQTTYSLTQAGCDELRNPQWSFDGSYLSVDVPCGGTAVLQLP